MFSFLIVLGLIGSQVFPLLIPQYTHSLHVVIETLTMVCLSFIMIHVGFEFTLKKNHAKEYAWDYFVAATAATFPWILCAGYFYYNVPTFNTPGISPLVQTLLISRFAAPTSAGILFSMLAAAGLGYSWVFRKARILAIFDDLDTILLLIPLKMLIIGWRFELVAVGFLILYLLWAGWTHMHRLYWPITWKWVYFYAFCITAIAKLIYYFTEINPYTTAIHFEVLLPAFIVGCIIDYPTEHRVSNHPKAKDLDLDKEHKVGTINTSIFMLLVGLSMPSISAVLNGGSEMLYISDILWHVLMITLLSNVGKMFPLFCYRKHASISERLALCVSMFPRGEVGAGVIAIALAYQIKGPMVAIAILSLILNLVLTGLFIYTVKSLIKKATKKQAKFAKEMIC